MKTNFVIAALATLCMGITKSFADPDPNFHIYLAFGQSNMQSGDIEEQDKNVDSRFQMIATTECGGRKLGEWYTAVPPLAFCENGLGPVPYFGNTLVEKLPKEIKVGVAVVGIPGCDIQLFEKENYQTYEHADWMTSYIENYGNSPYDRLVDMGKKAQEVGVIKGILVHQGETNNGDVTWPKRLKAIYENILGELNLKAENVPLLVGELLQTEEGGICGGMNEIIQTVPSVIPTAHVISSSGLKQQGDGFHFTSESQRIFGSRYAEAMLALLDTTPATKNEDECFSIKLGYPCCENTNRIYLIDEDGKWGYEKHQWCGHKPSPIADDDCWSLAQNYVCCSSSSAEEYLVDESGRWGAENGDWCGIPLSN